MATSRMSDQIGRVLGGRYRLVSLIGAGASAQVYRAEDVVLGRRVAVKVLHPALADDEAFLRRFRAEARAAAALSHPNVMAVYDWGEDDHTPYLVLELLEGGSLLDVEDAGHRLTPSQALVVGLEAARALDYAHRRGLVHRDVKPANLLFDEEGRLRVADFGLARALAEASWTEPAGALLGSPRYASPEQARGVPLTGRSDVYSLALVLIEAVTGDVPFAADTTIGTLVARVDRPVEVPPALDALVPVLETAGRPDPDERPDAAGLVAGLEAAARHLDRPAPLPLRVAADDDLTVVLDPSPTVLTSSTALFDQEMAGGPAGPADGRGTRRRRRGRGPLVAAIVLLVLALGAVAGYAAWQASIPSHEVPVLRGKTEAEARRLAQARELDLEVVERRYDETVPAGQVIDQDPSTGSLKEGRAIEVIVSRGPPPVGVPDLANLDQAAAEQRLREAGLVVGQVDTPFHEEIAAGIVLDWSPKGGEAPKGSAVNLVVSAGPQPRPVPDVRGRTYEEAARLLEEAQLVPVRVEAFDDEVEKGKVVGTDPASGQTAPRDAEVKVIVSKGPDLVRVPDVRGLSVEAATEVMEEAGLKVTAVKGSPRDRVRSTDPDAGERVKRGSAVSLITG
jgi:serine/threonine-protein kinase